MPTYVLHAYPINPPMVEIELPSNTQPLDALSAAHHYVDTEQAIYVEVYSIGINGRGRLLGTAGNKPNV